MTRFYLAVANLGVLGVCMLLFGAALTGWVAHLIAIALVLAEVIQQLRGQGQRVKGQSVTGSTIGGSVTQIRGDR